MSTIDTNHIQEMKYVDLRVRDRFVCTKFPMYSFLYLEGPVMMRNEVLRTDIFISKEKANRLFGNKDVYLVERHFKEEA